VGLDQTPLKQKQLLAPTRLFETKTAVGLDQTFLESKTAFRSDQTISVTKTAAGSDQAISEIKTAFGSDQTISEILKSCWLAHTSLCLK
jgi:hypothetical protein